MSRLSIIALFLTCSMFSHANHLSPEDALSRVTTSSMKKARANASGGYELSKTISSTNGMPAIYLFSSQSGSLVVSGSDNVTPLLGYLDGTSANNELPESFEFWLQSMADEVAYSESNDLPESPVTSVGAPISPLLPTLWGQTGAYNKFTPVVSDRQSPSGCVATALAQIMYYHQWPINPTGSATCKDTNSNQYSMDYDGITFEWDKMTTSYDSESTEESIDAVATLMKAVGYGVNMNYGPYSSGATSTDALNGMIRNFGYSKDLDYMRREAFTRQEWEEMLYAMLANGQPIYHTGRDAVWIGSGGHAFVCDGYDGNGYFHFNWGWDGSYNGYFLTSCLVPDGAGTGGYINGYNYSQEVLINLYPDNGRTYPNYQYVKGLSFNYSQTDKTISASFTSRPSSTSNISYEIGLSFTPSGASTATVKGVSQQSGEASATWQLDEAMTAGLDQTKEYTVRIMWRQNSADEWQRVLSPVEGSLLYYSGVFGGILRYENDEWVFESAVVDRDSFDVTVNDILFNDNYSFFLNKGNAMTLNVTNNANDYFYHAIRIYFIDVETGNSPRFINLSLELAPNETSVEKFSLRSISDIPAGKYYLEIKEANTGELIYSNKSKIYYVVDETTLLTTDDGMFVYEIMPQGFAVLVNTVSGAPVEVEEIVLPASIQYEGTDIPVTLINKSLKELISVQTLKSLKIQCPVSTIGDYALSDCKLLEKLELPQSLKSIGNYCFLNCNQLLELVLPAGLETINDGSFYGCNALEKLELPQSLISIGEFAFRYCYKLEELVLPDNLGTIGDFAFHECRTLAKLELPQSLKSIGKHVFNNCWQLEELTLPDGLETIGDYAFYGCNALEKLTIPSTVLSMGNYCFLSYSAKPTEIICEGELPTAITENTFYSNCYQTTKVYVPYGSLTTYEADDQWKKFLNIFTDGFEYAVPEKIELSGSEVSLMINSEAELPTATVYPLRASQEIDWKTADNTVIEISENKIVGLGVGNALIKAYPANESLENVFGEFHVEVLPIPAEEVTLNVPSIYLSTGNTFQLEAEVLPTNTTFNTVNWRSTDETVATVSSEGLVTALSDGEATVTAECGDAVAECRVHVRHEIAKGDANGNGTVNIADAVNTANYSLGNPVAEFCLEAADVNNDNRITFSDAVGIITIVLDQPLSATFRVSSAVSREATCSDALVVNDFVITNCDTSTVAVVLECVNGYVALQADITVSEGLTLNDVKMAANTSHKLMSRRIDDHTFRIALFDPQNSLLPAGSTLLELPVSSDKITDGEISLTNVIGVDEAGNEFMLNGRDGKGTGVSSLTDNTVGNIRVEATSEGIVIFNAEGHAVTIHDISGRTLSGFNATSAKETCRLVAGTYIVSLDNQNFKVFVR